MNKYEVPIKIGNEFPEIHKELRHLAVLGNVYESINVLTAFTRKMAAAHQFKKVQRCMELANYLHERGNALVKNAVENIFIYSFSLMRASSNPIEWRLLRAVIPSRLFLMYVHQVNASAS